MFDFDTSPKLDTSKYPKLTSFLEQRGHAVETHEIDQYLIDHVNNRIKLLNESSILLKPLGNVQAFINSNPYLFACVTLQDIPAIIVSNTTNIILSDLFKRLLCNPNIFSNIGQPELGALYPETQPIYAENYIDFIKSVGTGDYKVQAPKCKTRLYLASFLTQIANIFILEHELYHYLNGHLDFINNEFNASEIEETNKDINEKSLLYITLECDADSCAAQQSLRRLMAAREELDKESSVIYQFLENENDLIGFIIFSLNTLFLIWIKCQKNKPPKDIFKSSHPTPKLRLFNTQIAILGYVGYKYTHLDLQKVEEIIKSSLVSSVKGLSNDTDEIKEIMLKLALSEDENLLNKLTIKKWSEIRDNLQKFAYHNIAPAETQHI